MSQAVQPQINGAAVSDANPLPVKISGALGGGTAGGALESTQLQQHTQLQNLVSTIGTGTTGMSLWTVATKYKANVTGGGTTAGDEFLKIDQYSQNAPAAGVAWTTLFASSWVKTYSAATAALVYTAGTAPADVTKCSVIESGLMLKQVWLRTRNVLSVSAGAQTSASVTETRTIQFSHIYPYPVINDSGWA
jgi:hypothetical protein